MSLARPHPSRLAPLLTLAACAIGGCGGGADEPVRPVLVKPLALIISGDTGGWITPCGCASNQSGGMLRRGTYLADVGRTHHPIYLDAGGAAGGVSDYHKEKFEAILRGEMKMGLAAHNVGKSELALGLDYLKDVRRRLNVPLISANLIDAQGNPVFDDLRIIDANGRKLAIIGVISPSFVSGDLKPLDPRQAILGALARHGDKVKGAAIIVLAYVPENDLAALAAALPEVDAVIGGPTGQAIAPRRAGPVTLASATNKGKFLIRLESSKSGDPWLGDAVEMGPALADDPGQTANVKAYLGRLEQADFAASRTAVAAAPPDAAPADYRFAGSQACAACHAPDQNLWHSSKHSHAMDTLLTKGFHVDSYCQSCHTTGFGQPGGFEKLSTDKSLFGVGCENCHGPSVGHVKETSKRTPWRATDQCVRCHDHENSPSFEFAAYWSRITHGKKAAGKGSNR